MDIFKLGKRTCSITCCPDFCPGSVRAFSSLRAVAPYYTHRAKTLPSVPDYLDIRKLYIFLFTCCLFLPALFPQTGQVFTAYCPGLREVVSEKDPRALAFSGLTIGLCFPHNSNSRNWSCFSYFY